MSGKIFFILSDLSYKQHNICPGVRRYTRKEQHAIVFAGIVGYPMKLAWKACP